MKNFNSQSIWGIEPRSIFKSSASNLALLKESHLYERDSQLLSSLLNSIEISTTLLNVIRLIEKLIKWFEDFFHLNEIPLSFKGIPFGKKLQYSLLKSIMLYRRHQGLILRALLSWIIGLLALHLDEVNSYDFRLALRGDQSPNSQIALLEFTPTDLHALLPPKNSLRDLKDDTALSHQDSRYWNLSLWRELLTRILQMNPKVVGVSFFFDENMNQNLTRADWELFTDERIVWMGALSQGGTVELPPFADHKKQNFGFGEFPRDEDGMVRSIPPHHPHHPSFALKLAEKLLAPQPLTPPRLQSPLQKTMINFRGSAQAFTHLNVKDLLLNQIPQEGIEDKAIIIGLKADGLSTLASPVGNLSRAELLAHMTDNFSRPRWIRRLPKPVAFAELFIVMIISVFLMNYFPQKVAFVFLSILNLFIIGLSLWFFDTFFLWTPALSPLIQITCTWALFVGYIASKIEQKNWQLEHEKNSLAQLEQLKNNFVSLISHDLKTPIAKIQAIVDRLLLSEQAPEVVQDLKSLRGSSHELHRYIQSILKILRVESRDFHLNKEVADINELVQSSLSQIRPLAQEKQISLQDNLEPLFSLEVDSTLIQEVLNNLLENAVKYTPPQGQVFVETEEIDGFVLIRVRDTGEGIRPEDIDNVFKKFVRGKNQDLKTKGSGLGLYLVKYFVELHGGRVSLTSQLGKGTTVDLYLPTEN